MDTTEPMKNAGESRRINRRLSVGYASASAAFWVLHAITTSFAIPFLVGRGYSNTEAGVLIAAANLLAVLVQPVYGNGVDRAKKLSAVDIAALTALAILCLFTTDSLLTGRSAVLSAAYLFTIACVVTFQPLLNALPQKLNTTGAHVEFGIARSISCVSYALGCSVIGALSDRFGTEAIPRSGAVTVLLMFAALVATRAVFRRAAEANQRSSAASEEPKPEPISFREFFTRRRAFVIASLGVVLLMYSNSVYNAYILRIVENVGGTHTDMGRILAMKALLEIPALLFFRPLQKRFGARKLLMASSVGFLVKGIGMALAGNIAMLYVAQLAHIAVYGLILASMVAFIQEIMTERESVRGQAVFTTAITTATVLANFTGGFLIDRGGVRLLLFTALALSAAGMVYFFVTVPRVPGLSASEREAK